MQTSELLQEAGESLALSHHARWSSLPTQTSLVMRCTQHLQTMEELGGWRHKIPLRHPSDYQLPSGTWFVELNRAHAPSAAPNPCASGKKATIPEGTSGSHPAPSTPRRDLMYPRLCWPGSAGMKAVLSTAILHGHCPPRGNGNHSRVLRWH